MNDNVIILDETAGNSKHGHLLKMISKVWGIDYVTNTDQLLSKLRREK